MTTAGNSRTQKSGAAHLNNAIPDLAVVALSGWIGVTGTLGALLALQVLDGSPWGETPRNFSTTEMIWTAAIIMVACLASALGARLTRPELTLPLTFATSGAIVLAGAVVTGSIAALAQTGFFFAIAWLVGGALLRMLPATGNVPVVRLPLAIALGLGVLGYGFFLLGSLSLLNVLSVAAVVSLLVVVALAGGREGLRADVSTLRRWPSGTLSWFEATVFALATGLVTFATLTAFVPEIQTDATREHLPIAREIWQSGGIGVFFPMGVSRDPVQGHLFYAVAFGIGGSTAATLVQTFVGLTAFAGVAALGWLVAGRVAAICGAVIFATMPMVLWQLGHAFMDLFPVLFMVTATACILLWQRDGAWSWLIAAGALAGIGFACKVTMGWSIFGLLASLLLVGRGPWQWRGRFAAFVAFGIGMLVVVPWLIRGYLTTGDVIGIDVLFRLLTEVSPELAASLRADTPSSPTFLLDTATQEAAVTYLDQRGLGHTSLAFVLALWELTFHGERFRFPLIGRGEIGISLLMLLPVALVGPRNRAMAFLSLAAFASYAVWFLTPYQIARHLLPTLAVASALGGIGVASVVGITTPRWKRVLPSMTRFGLFIGCLAVPFLLLPSARATLPVGIFLGTESRESYIQQAVPSATSLLASSRLLPPDTPVAYIGGVWEGPQIYTEARLIYIVPSLLGDSAAEIIGNLDRLDLRYLIWNRREATDNDWRAPALSSTFLEEHARILAGDDDAYLLEIVPGGVKPWGSQSPGNMLRDPEFTSVRKGNGPWIASERAAVNDGQITLRRRASLSQEVEVQGGTSYVLTAHGACADPGDQVALGMQWFADDGAEIANHTERVLPGIEPNDQFIWRTAPDAATRVVVSVAPTGSASCDFSRIALHQAD